MEIWRGIPAWPWMNESNMQRTAQKHFADCSWHLQLLYIYVVVLCVAAPSSDRIGWFGKMIVCPKRLFLGVPEGKSKMFFFLIRKYDATTEVPICICTREVVVHNGSSNYYVTWQPLKSQTLQTAHSLAAKQASRNEALKQYSKHNTNVRTRTQFLQIETIKETLQENHYWGL